PNSDIVLSSRIRLARNFDKVAFPIIAETEELEKIHRFFRETYAHESFQDYRDFEFVPIDNLSPVETQVLVEKHLISPHLAKKSKASAALISKNEQVSIMINEEDHIRIQLYFPGFQLDQALEKAFELDDWMEEQIDYAFD